LGREKPLRESGEEKEEGPKLCLENKVSKLTSSKRSYQRRRGSNQTEGGGDSLKYNHKSSNEKGRKIKDLPVQGFCNTIVDEITFP